MPVAGSVTAGTGLATRPQGPGTSVKLGMIHDGQEKTVTLTLGTLPNEKQAANQQKEHEVPDSDVPKLGLTLAPGSKVAGSDGSAIVPILRASSRASRTAAPSSEVMTSPLAMRPRSPTASA